MKGTWQTNGNGGDNVIPLVIGLLLLSVAGPVIITAIHAIVEMAIAVVAGVGVITVLAIVTGLYLHRHPPSIRQIRPYELDRWKYRQLPPDARKQIDAVRTCHWCPFTDQPMEVLFHEIENHRG